MPAYIRERIRDPDYPLRSRARELGLDLVLEREVIPSTRRAHQCAEFARSQGHLEAFHRAVLRRYWAQGEDLHDWACLRAAAHEAGLNADTMQREVEAGAWRAALEAGLAQAAEVGVHAVPTFLVGGRFVIQGAQDAAVFRHALAKLGVTPR